VTVFLGTERWVRDSNTLLSDWFPGGIDVRKFLLMKLQHFAGRTLATYGITHTPPEYFLQNFIMFTIVGLK
jgi:hypothetical protein